MLSINSLDLCRWGSADETIHLQSVIASLYCPGLLQWRQLKAWPCWDSDSVILAAHLQGKAETSMTKEYHVEKLSPFPCWSWGLPLLLSIYKILLLEHEPTKRQFPWQVKGAVERVNDQQREAGTLSAGWEFIRLCHVNYVCSANKFKWSRGKA